MTTQVMKYQIIKPTNCDWELLKKILKEIQYETRQILNKSIQLSWEYQCFSSDYKEKFDVYPKTKEILNYSNTHNYCYDALKSKFIKLYSNNLSQTIKRATDKFKSDSKEILRGDKSIPNYKKDCPIDIVSQAIDIIQESNKYYLNISLISTKYKKELNLPSGKFLVQIKVGSGSPKAIIDRILSGEYKISASQIVQKKNKWLINLSYSFEPNKQNDLDPNTVMGIDLGIKNVAYFAFNNSPKRGYIEGGEIDEFRRRTEKRRSSILKQGKYCGEGRRGHGINTRLKPIKKISDKVSNFRNLANHKYSKYIIEQALKNNAGIIQMEDLSGIDKDDRFLKNWSYSDLKQKIEYKAEREGIKVEYIYPKYTSQRCSKCGHIDKNSRSNQANFKCTSCGKNFNADYNAAKNISLSNIEELIEEQCKIQGLPYKKKSVKKSA